MEGGVTWSASDGGRAAVEVATGATGAATRSDGGTAGVPSSSSGGGDPGGGDMERLAEDGDGGGVGTAETNQAGGELGAATLGRGGAQTANSGGIPDGGTLKGSGRSESG